PAPSPTHQRLQRILADAGVASRRASEKLIEEGRVEVNGRIVQALPAFADPDVDRIEVDGKPIRRAGRGGAGWAGGAGAAPEGNGRAGSGRSRAAAQERAAARGGGGGGGRENHLYIMLNKPARTLTTTADEPGMDRRTVTDLVDHP